MNQVTIYFESKYHARTLIPILEEGIRVNENWLIELESAFEKGAVPNSTKAFNMIAEMKYGIAKTKKIIEQINKIEDEEQLPVL